MVRLAENLGREYRHTVALRLKRAGRTRDHVANVKLPHIGSRSRHWVDVSLSNAQPLALDTALEIATRLRRLRVRLPDKLLERIFALRASPMVIILPGEGSDFARLLAREAGRIHGVSESAVARMAARFSKIFQTIEGFNDTPPGKEIVALTGFDVDPNLARLQMHRFRSPLMVKGREWAVRSVSSLIEQYVLSR